MTTETPRRSEWIRSAVELHQGRLIRFARRITGDLESARDVVQDTFMRLCREDPAGVDHLPSWLFRVCRNRALDVRRKEAPLERLDDADALPVSSHDPQETVETDESQRRVLAALADLSAPEQEVLRLRFQEELSYKEISTVTGRSVSHVGVLIHTGVKRLRQQLRSAEQKTEGRPHA